MKHSRSSMVNISIRLCYLWIVVDRYISPRPIYRPILVIFKISLSADNFFRCVRGGILLFLFHRSVLSNTNRSLSNNKIELLNKGIKMYTKSIITIALISNKGKQYFLVCRQHSANTHLYHLNKSLND